MKIEAARPVTFHRSRYALFIGTFFLVASAIAGPFYSVDSSSRGKIAPPIIKMSSGGTGPLHSRSVTPLNLPAVTGESVTLYAADCVTPKSAFSLGEVVCAKTDGVDLVTTPGNYYMNWIDSSLGQTNGGTITQNPQYFLFAAPAADTYKASIGSLAPADSSIIGVPPQFTVTAGAPAIAIYASDCTTPKSVFNLQDSNKTVCAKVTGGNANQYILWSNARFEVTQSAPLGTGESSFTLTGLSSLGDWRVILFEPFGGSVYQVVSFTVIDAQNPSADVMVSKGTASTAVAAGSQVVFTLTVTNLGPDDALAVELTDSIPTNTTFSSFAPVSAPMGTNCIVPSPGAALGDSVCTIPVLARGETATFLAAYDVLTGVASGTLISNTVTVESTTPDPRAANNAATSTVSVSGAGAETCALDCPANVVVTANTTQGGQPGAFVDYGAASGAGNCGAVTNNPASGTFFEVGTHSIISSSEFGGGSCTFTVTVLDTNPPTITCPTGVTVNLASGETEATLTLPQIGNPTINASGGGTVTSVRSDDVNATYDDNGNVVTPAVVHALTDPYQIGTTGITWTVTDAGGRKASCTQLITVNGHCASDTASPTIDAPANITVATGPDNTGCTVALDDELGQAVADDDCSVTVTVSGIPANNHFPKGTTTLIYTATDPSGHTATDTQTVTVVDNTLPIIGAPANASYTCLSEVPAASPSQATGPVLGIDGQFVRDGNGDLVMSGPAFDNCGAPTVTVTETSIGTGTAASPKVITRTYTATDASLNTASATQTIVVTDPTLPTISCPANITVYLPLNSPATSTVVNYTTPVGADNCAGAVTTQTAGLASGASFPVGTTTNTFRVTDAVGNYAECSFTVTVLYNFTGFFNPVNNPPTFNNVNAGRSIPLKFSLSGNKGLNIFAAGYPASQQIACNTSATLTDLEGTETPGGSTLTYSPDTYHYNWKTESSWAGQCRLLVVKLNDGSEHTALFKFK